MGHRETNTRALDRLRLVLKSPGEQLLNGPERSFFEQLEGRPAADCPARRKELKGTLDEAFRSDYPPVHPARL